MPGWHISSGGGGGGGGTGDVVGPAASVDGQIAVFDGVTGKLLKVTAATFTAAGSLTIPSAETIEFSTDVGIARTAAGVIRITDGGAGQGKLEVMDNSTIGAPALRGIVRTTYGFSIADSGGVPFVSLVAAGVGIFGVSTTGAFFDTGKSLSWTHGGMGSGWAIRIAPTTGFGSNADVLSMDNGAGAPRAWLAAVRLEANTAGSGAPNIIAAVESGTHFTNEGSAAANYEALPTADAGCRFTFIVQDADGMRIVANGGDTIRVIDKVTAAAGYIESTTIGSTVTLVSVNATEWYAVAINGIWTDGTFTYDDTGLTTP